MKYQLTILSVLAVLMLPAYARAQAGHGSVSVTIVPELCNTTKPSPIFFTMQEDKAPTREQRLASWLHACVIAYTQIDPNKRGAKRALRKVAGAVYRDILETSINSGELMQLRKKEAMLYCTGWLDIPRHPVEDWERSRMASCAEYYNLADK